MSSPRLVILVRRFWPLCGSTARAAGLLVRGLVQQGCGVTVLTTPPGARGPGEIDFAGARVVRLSPVPEGRWDRLRHLRATGRWLAGHRDDYQLVYVFGLKHEARAALRAVGDRVPVVLRPEQSGSRGDCFWQLDEPGGRRIKSGCMRAAAFVGATPLLEAELKAAGYPRPRIHYVPLGVRLPPMRVAGTQLEARRILARAHSVLELSQWTPLVVYDGCLTDDRRIETLLDTWRILTVQRPNARLWLVGSGPARPEIQRRVDSLGLGGRVAMPGVFDEPDLLLAAADALVVPGPPDGTPLALFEAMAAGLPIVATDVPGHRVVATHEENALLVPPDNAPAVAAALERLLSESGLAARLGDEGRRRIEAEFTLANSVQQHLTLFEKLIHGDR